MSFNQSLGKMVLKPRIKKLTPKPLTTTSRRRLQLKNDPPLSIQGKLQTLWIYSRREECAPWSTLSWIPARINLEQRYIHHHYWAAEYQTVTRRPSACLFSRDPNSSGQAANAKPVIRKRLLDRLDQGYFVIAAPTWISIRGLGSFGLYMYDKCRAWSWSSISAECVWRFGRGAVRNTHSNWWNGCILRPVYPESPCEMHLQITFVARGEFRLRAHI